MSDGVTPAGGAWWAISGRFDDPATLTGFRLGIGPLGGPAHVIEQELEPLRGDRLRWGQPKADGPAAGLIAYAFGDGQSSEVWTASIDDGQPTKVGDLEGIVASIELDRTRGVAYVVTGRLPFEAVDLVIVDLASGAIDVLATISVSSESDDHIDTELDESSGHLLLLACGVACRLTGIDVGQRTVSWDRPSDFQTLAGSVPGSVLAARPCGTPCATQRIDTADGIGERSAEACDVATLGIRFGTTAVVTDSDGQSCRRRGEPTTLYIFQGPGLEPVASKVLAEGYALVVNGWDGGYEATPGSVVLSPGGSMQPLIEDPAAGQLLDLATGAVALPGG
ncbi:MAG: hypothetical protein WEC14_02075 [Chloroflexota bacterium]